LHRGMPKVNLKTHFQKNHALAESLLSRVFSWDVVDVGFPTCFMYPHICIKNYLFCSIQQVLYFGLGSAWRRQMAQKERQIRKDTGRWEVIVLFF
jgi:hypothetical protein